MLLPLSHDLVTVRFDLSAFITIDYAVSGCLPKVLRVFSYPFNRLHQSLVDIPVIDIFNIGKRYENSTRGFRNSIRDMV